MKKTTKTRIALLLSALILLAALSACGEKDEAAEPADTPASTEAAEAGSALFGEYTATKMISNGESIDIEPMHLTVNEDGSGVMSDNNGSYSVTFYFDDGTGVITELQSYFTFTLEEDSLILIDGRGTETVFESDG